MIVDLPNTSTTELSKRLVKLRNDVGSMTLGRVLTLIVVVDDAHANDAIAAANEASRQHPCRIVVLVRGTKRGAPQLDGQIRLGGDAGASEVVVARLYGKLADQAPSVVVPLLLPDSPIVVWWANEAPKDVAKDPIGRMAQRRITDASMAKNPTREIRQRAESYVDGDTDLAWTRITKWRGLLAAALDQPPYEQITHAVVAGAPDSPSTDLLAAWLHVRLKCPVHRVKTPRGSGIESVRLERESGPVDLVRPGDSIATLLQPGQPDRRIALTRRELPECLADELRRLDPDDTYQDALQHGLPKLQAARLTASQAIGKGLAPSPQEAARIAERLERDSSAKEASAMMTAHSETGSAEPEVVKAATARKLAGGRTPREKQADERAAKAAPVKEVTSAGKAATRKAPATSAAKKATAKKAASKTTAKKSASKKSTTKATASKGTSSKTTASKTTAKTSTRKSATTSAAKATKKG